MELIHADHNRTEVQSIVEVKIWDLVSGLSHEYKANNWQLSVPKEVWTQIPIVKGNYLYEPGTEWGGRVEGVKSQTEEIILTGPTWRGLLSRKVISPPAGQAYKVITSMDANAAIAELISNSFGELVKVKSEIAGVNVSGQFRYANLLGAIHTMLNQYGLRLSVEYFDRTVWLSAEPIQDLSDESELSQDYSVDIDAEENEAEAYNHVIALGQGELVSREVIELYRNESGTITSTPLPAGIEDKQVVLDFPNAESTEELIKSATEKLIAHTPIKKIGLRISEDLELNLGDLVGGRDYVTGLAIVQPVTQIIRRVDASGDKVEYKIGE